MKYEDTPSAKNWLGTPAENPKEVTYEEGIYVGYRYFNTFKVKPSYEFGFGKSYTDFSYSDLKLSSATFKNNLKVTVKITNTGKVSGKEIVELYLSAPQKLVDKPNAELKAFAKTKELKPGESEIVTMELKPEDLASFVTAQSSWIAEAGTYKISIGASSLDVKQSAEFQLNQNIIVKKVQPVFKAEKEFSDLKSKN